MSTTSGNETGSSFNAFSASANWLRLLTNQFDNAGNFNFTNPPNTNWPLGFYLLQVS